RLRREADARSLRHRNRARRAGGDADSQHRQALAGTAPVGRVRTLRRLVTEADRSALESKTRYDPTEVEPRIVERWLESGMFHPEPEDSAAENYSIAIPPPNVTGSLHMGHALNGSIQDVLVRYHRMCGRRTKWVLGTDNAGIATQTQV